MPARTSIAWAWETEVVQWTEQKGPFEDPDVPDRLSALASGEENI